MNILISLLVTTILSTNSYGAKIGLIDSFIDLEHETFINKLWYNHRERRNGKDDDRNGKIDDIHGWNFVDNNHVFLDRSKIGSYSDNIFKYYEIKFKRSTETSSKKEDAWYWQIKKDPDFVKEYSDFRSFIHGTHVGSLAIETVVGSEPHELMAIKYLGSKDSIKHKIPNTAKWSDKKKYSLLNKIINLEVNSIIIRLKKAINYLSSKNVDVINCSFGSSFKKYKEFVSGFYEKIFLLEPDEDKANTLTNDYIQKLIMRVKTIVENNSHIVFVMSAGNSKLNNDEFFHYPSNVSQFSENVITVGASYDFSERAYFSNWGLKTVDLLAPGVAIHASIPGNQYLLVNGTSQSAPQVTNIVANIINLIRDYKLNISSKEIRYILNNTVDKLQDMKGKIRSGGVVNSERAYTAIKLLKTMSINEAIQLSKKIVRQVSGDSLYNPKLSFLKKYSKEDSFVLE